jgi:Tfp pilus assembly protein PilV
VTRLRDEAGYSIIELLVACLLFALISAGFYQVMHAQARTADTTRTMSRIADEARLGFNRMIRDVREADSIAWISSDQNQFTIYVNYNGDSYYQDPNPVGDNEVLTYTYDPVAETVTLCAALTYSSCNASNSEILMSGVEQIGTAQVFAFSSSVLDYDWDDSGDTTWQEVDAASNSTHNILGVGDDDGSLDAPEFPYLTTITFAMCAREGTTNCASTGSASKATGFYAKVQMRNKT